MELYRVFERAVEDRVHALAFNKTRGEIFVTGDTDSNIRVRVCSASVLCVLCVCARRPPRSRAGRMSPAYTPRRRRRDAADAAGRSPAPAPAAAAPARR